MDDLQFVQVDEPYRVRLVSEPTRPPAADEVLLRARRSLISTGSELRRYRRYAGYDAFQYPVTDLGYSMVGEVVAIGAAVEGVAVGERYVTVQRHATLVHTRANVDGVRTAVRVPEGVSDEAATFGPLLRSTVNWIRNAAITVTDTVVVVGQGLVGALQLQAARLHSPQRTIVTDTWPLRLDLARRCGADEVINAATEDPVAEVRRLTGGQGAEVVIETVGGAAVDSFAQALRMCRGGGRLVAVGMHTAPVPVPAHTIHDKLVIGSQIGYDVGAAVFARAMALLAQGQFAVEPLITHRYDYRRVAEAYALLDERPGEALGVVLEW